MSDFDDLQPPEPARSWTETHQDGDTIKGLVTKREDFTVKDTGKPFTVIQVQGTDGITREVPLGRSDLLGLVNDDVDTGDAVAIKYWGKSGQKYVYTYQLRRLSEAQALA